MARRKVKNGEKSPCGQCLTRPVPNGRRRSGSVRPASSETQEQIVGASGSLNGRENMARRKAKNGEKSSWGMPAHM